MNVETLPEDVTPRLPAGMLDNLLRAQSALELLAVLDAEAAHLVPGLTLNHTAALASYASEDMDSLLTGIEVLPEV